MSATVPEFASEQDAWDWLEAQVDDPCVDNQRLGYEQDQASLDAYEQAVRAGCCGSADYEVVIAGRRARIGCNYGH